MDLRSNVEPSWYDRRLINLTTTTSIPYHHKFVIDEALTGLAHIPNLIFFVFIIASMRLAKYSSGFVMTENSSIPFMLTFDVSWS